MASFAPPDTDEIVQPASVWQPPEGDEIVTPVKAQDLAPRPLIASPVNQPSMFSSGLPPGTNPADNPDWGFTKAVANQPAGFVKSIPGDISQLVEAGAAAALNLPERLRRTMFTPKETVTTLDASGRPQMKEQAQPLPFQSGVQAISKGPFIDNGNDPVNSLMNKLITGMTTPGMIATLPLAETGLIKGYFLTQTVPGAIEGARTALDPTKTPKERIEGAMSGGVNSLFSYLLGKAGPKPDVQGPLATGEVSQSKSELPPNKPTPAAPAAQERMSNDMKNAWAGKLQRVETIGRIRELEEGWGKEIDDPNQQHKLELLAERKAEISDELNRGDALQQFFDESSPEMQKKIDAHLEKLNANRKLNASEQKFDDFLEQQIGQRLNKVEPKPFIPPAEDKIVTPAGGKQPTLVPALLVDGKPVIGGVSHAEIVDNFKGENKLDVVMAAMDDKNHVYVDENNNVLTRDTARAKLAQITGKPVTKPVDSSDIPEVVKPSTATPIKPEEAGRAIAKHIGATFDGRQESPGGKSPNLLQFTWREADVPKDSPIWGATFYIREGESPESAMATAKAKAAEFGVQDYGGQPVPAAVGFTRLYRGEGTPDQAKLPEWAKSNAGQWFSSSEKKARDFQAMRGGKLITVDVPTDQLKQFQAPSGNAPDEYLMPQETVQNLTKPAPPAEKPLTAASEQATAEANRLADEEFQKQNQGELVGMGAAKTGEVSAGAGADIYGIAQRVREERARAGQVAEVPTGEGISAPDSVERGRQLLQAGGDAEKAVANFEKTNRLSADDMALARAKGEELAQAARSIEEKFGTTTPEYLMAQKALSDWDARTKPMQTEWHKMGRAQQGETDIDTGTFTGLQRAYRDSTGKEFTPQQAAEARKIAANVKAGLEGVKKAWAELQKVLDRETQPKVEPNILRLADKIIAAMDKKAGDALDRIKARQAQDRAFSIADPADLDDVIIYGAAKITKGVAEFADWSAQMLSEVGKGIEPYLRKIYDAAVIRENRDTTELAGGRAERDKVRKAKTPKAPADLKEQQKAFQDYESGKPMNPEQVKTLWTRARTDYIDKGNGDHMDVVYKLASDFGIPAKDVLKGLSQSKSVKRVADDMWQKQRQARMLKASAKRWIDTANETALSKALPTTVRIMFSAKVGLHGTVAIGTHAALEAAAHPIITAQNFGKMYKLVASPEYYRMQQYELARRPNYNVAQRNGLINDMSKMEDFNDPRLAQGFPKAAEWFRRQFSKIGLGRLQGMGTRGYSVLKILRQDLFDNEWNKLAESEKSPEMARAMADSINHMTGVVKAGTHSVANVFLFAPKLLLSRVAVMAGDPLRAINSMTKMSNMSPAEKWFLTNQVKEKAKIFAVATGLLYANQQINSFFGDKKKLNGIPEAFGGGGWNPMESDFMKFRVAGMNFAWGSPYLNMMRLPMRIIQIGSGDGGKAKYLIYPDESMSYEAFKFARSQASPFISPIISLVTKTDYSGRPLPQIPGYGTPPPVPKRLRSQGIKPYTWTEFASETMLPIPFAEGAKEVFHYMGAKPGQEKPLLKAFTTVIIMGGTGGRLAEDWKKQTPTNTGNPFKE